jgi:hypothetical protein|tara:strand:+ start:829 stop:1131 length:303 start_codon:yes stop_codon:yes gene_type:complete
MAMTEAEKRMSAEGTRNLSKSELKKLRDVGEISQEEYDDKMRFIRLMQEQDKKQNPKRRPPPPKPKPKPKMMGGGMAGKKPRMGHTDYRKGGMMYKTTKG